MSNKTNDNQFFDASRRRVLAGIAASAAGAAGLAACGGSSSPSGSSGASGGPQPTGTLPDPKASGIDQIVVVMMENRSFDHYLGWLPGADGKQAGLSFKDSAGNIQQTHPLAPNFQNCQSADPDHSYAGGRTQLDGGKMDGFLLTQPVGDTFPIGYYVKDDLSFLGPCTDHWTICDRYFCGILSSTYPNRFYMHAGQTDRIDNASSTSKLPTVWDSMKAVGASANYYYGDIPFTALWGSKYLDISRPFASFLLDAAAGQLPNLSFVDPTFLGEGQGVSHDDHPLADIRNGQAFLNQVYDAVRNSPQWSSTLLVINYDEWGGFFDHVEPPFAPITQDEFAAIGNDGRLGFRVPCIIIGPRARRGHVENLQFDPNSILNMIAWRFGFAPLGARASSHNLAYALDFSGSPNTDAPAFSVPSGPFGSVCGLPAVLPAGTSTTELDVVQRRQAEHLLEWQSLQVLARRYGFAL